MGFSEITGLCKWQVSEFIWGNRLISKGRDVKVRQCYGTVIFVTAGQQAIGLHFQPNKVKTLCTILVVVILLNQQFCHQGNYRG